MTTKSYDLSVTASELVKEYPHAPAFSSIYNCITQNVLPKDKISQSEHICPVNTYYTIKDRYWIHNMFEKLQQYISSCEACQQQKQNRGKIPYFYPRIPLSYNPMSYISADIKYMPKGIYDYEFLLIAVCEITGFVIVIPLIKHDAVSIAHALIDRVFLIFGPP